MNRSSSLTPGGFTGQFTASSHTHGARLDICASAYGHFGWSAVSFAGLGRKEAVK